MLSIPHIVHAQHEVTVEDIGGDGDAVIEIIVDSSDNISPREMILGLNQTSEGFLRMLTDHDLSFWTFNQKRMTVTNTGEVGIGTSNALEKLYVKNGSLGLETETSGLFDTDERSSINFYTDSDYKAGITYGDTGADGKFMSFNNTDNSAFFWRSNSQTRMVLNADGSLRIDDLEGTDIRPVYVDANGTLIDEPTLEMSLDATDLVLHSSDRNDGELLYFFDGLKADIDLFVENIWAIGQPSMPYSKYLIEEVTYIFLDNTSENLEFQVDVSRIGSVSENFKSKSTGTSSNFREITISVDRMIDENAGDVLNCGAFFFDEDHVLRKVVIKYKPM